ncbi:MAG: NDP-sugar synthase, partial [Actinobacteria bacterium]|nr:NDP-sugar synthase [Actinomycetota bacterium]
MHAVVLVGGFGTRLRPLTLATPKPLLPIANLPLLERLMASLARGGVTDAVLSLGFKPEPFLLAFPSNVCAGVRLTYAVEDRP